MRPPRRTTHGSIGSSGWRLPRPPGVTQTAEQAAHARHDRGGGRELRHLGAGHDDDRVDEQADAGQDGRVSGQVEDRQVVRVGQAGHDVGQALHPAVALLVERCDPAGAAAPREHGHTARDRELVGQPEPVHDARDVGQLRPAPPRLLLEAEDDVERP